MTPSPLLPLATSLVSFAVASGLAVQWIRRRRSYQALWALGMLWFGIAAGAEALGLWLGWSEPLYRAWYLPGAVLVAAYLGAGQVYLLRGTGFGYVVAVSVLAGSAPALASVRPLTAAGNPEVSAVFTLGVGGMLAGVMILSAQLLRPAWTPHATLAALLVGSALVGAAVLGAPVDLGLVVDPRTGATQGDGFPQRVRLATPLFNIAGASTLVVGAGYSAWLTWRRRTAPRRAVGSALIALGAVAPTITSSQLRLGSSELAATGQLIGVLGIALGAYVATRAPRGGAETPGAIAQGAGSSRTALPTR